MGSAPQNPLTELFLTFSFTLLTPHTNSLHSSLEAGGPAHPPLGAREAAVTLDTGGALQLSSSPAALPEFTAHVGSALAFWAKPASVLAPGGHPAHTSLRVTVRRAREQNTQSQEPGPRVHQTPFRPQATPRQEPSPGLLALDGFLSQPGNAPCSPCQCPDPTCPELIVSSSNTCYPPHVLL